MTGDRQADKASENHDVPASGEESKAPSQDTSSQPDAEDRLIAERYRLKRRIGGGAMGVVFLAHDEVLDRTVAVKELLLPPTFSKEEAEHARKRSFREARMAARLQHRHAITVFNVVEDDGKPVLVMEYLPSRSLAEVLDERGSIPPGEAARIGADTASALAAAHAAGIVHRDVKPGNILIGENGIAKITDFGISRAADDGTLTGSGRFAGTPAFLSPEAARGEPPSQASDVFSLGATLYTAVEGRFPYGNIENQMALLYAAAAGRYDPPTKAGPLTGVLSHLMQINPDERPTMAEAAAELATVLAPEPPPENKQRRLLFAGLGLLVVVIAAGVTALVLLRDGTGGTANGTAPPPAPPASSSVAMTSAPPTTGSGAGQPPPLVSTTHTTTTTTTTTTAATESLTQAVSDYYSIVPGNLDLGWTRLGPDLQARQKDGKASYVSFWSQISHVEVVGAPHLVGPDTVEVTIEFVENGTRYEETHDLGMLVRDGQALVNTDTLVSSRTLG